MQTKQRSANFTSVALL